MVLLSILILFSGNVIGELCIFLNAQSLEKRGLCRVLLQENMTAATLTEALLSTWADRETLTAAVEAAPPADGTMRVLEMIEEVQR